MVEPSAAPAPPRGRIGRRPYTGDVEIRVHGVSGTPPEELLGRSDVRQVAGDRLSGFYRPSLVEQMRDEPPPDAPAAPTGGAGVAAGFAAGPATAGPATLAADRPADRAARGPWLEGYSWGGWTSGARSRVLWLVLLPFALVNVSSRMLPPEPPGHRVARALRLVAAALTRVLALSLTVTLVQGAVGVSMVTVALRCGTVPGRPGACHGLPVFVTDLLGRLSMEGRVLVCAAVPLAVTALLWLVSHQASARYENAPVRPPAGRPDDAPQPLLRADLWQSGPVISRLRLLHVQAGVVSVVGSAAWLLPGGTARAVTLWLVAVTFAVQVALVVRRPAPPYSADRRGRILLPARMTWILVGGTAGSLGWQVSPRLFGSGSGASGSGGTGAAGGIPRAVADLAVRHSDVLVQDLFVGQAVFLAIILVVAASARIAGAGRGRSLFVAGFAGFVMAMLSWLAGAMLTASTLVLVPAWLARPGFAFTPRQIATALADPATAGWFGNTTRSSGVGTGVGVAVLIVLVVQIGVRALVAARTGGTRRDRWAARHDYPGRATDTDPAVRRRARAIGTLFWWARRVDGVPRGMAVLCAAVAALLVVQGVALLSAGDVPSGWQATVLGRIAPACVAAADTGLCSHVDLVAWGVFCTAGLAVLVLVAGVLAYRTRAARRGVGVFWDLACFWPRDTHPLAPPCYNERIMPQVSVRVAWYLGTDDQPGAADAAGQVDSAGPMGWADPADPADPADAVDPVDPVGSTDPAYPAAGPGVTDPLRGKLSRGRLVLAGHSQGSVIALAAALIQPEAARRRLSLITVGCVLDRLYSRFFPRYFGPEIYRIAADMLCGDATSPDDPESPAGAPVRRAASPDGSLPIRRWTNIWRHSDYLGGAVPYPPDLGDVPTGFGPDNVRSIDPAFGPPPGDTVDPAAGRHSGFWTDPAFLPAVHRLLDASSAGGAPDPGRVAAADDAWRADVTPVAGR